MEISHSEDKNSDKELSDRESKADNDENSREKDSDIEFMELSDPVQRTTRSGRRIHSENLSKNGSSKMKPNRKHNEIL